MEEFDYEYYLIEGDIVARAIETEEKNTVELYLNGAWQEKDYDEEITKRWPDLGKSIIGIDYGIAMETLGKEADFIGRYSDDIKPRKDISTLGQIETMDEKEFINVVANDIVNDLDDEAKQITLEYPEYDHFGRGLWIRNHYLWCQNLPEKYRHPDDLSVDIFSRVIEILKEQTDR